MRVRKLAGCGPALQSWTVVDDHGVVEPVEQFLAHLAGVERSPNTVRAYAYDLRDFFSFLELRSLDWKGVGVDDLGGFVRWLRLTRVAREAQVLVLPGTKPAVGAATVNRKLAAVSAFYLFHQRCGVDVRRWPAGTVAVTAVGEYGRTRDLHRAHLLGALAARTGGPRDRAVASPDHQMGWASFDVAVPGGPVPVRHLRAD